MKPNAECIIPKILFAWLMPQLNSNKSALINWLNEMTEDIQSIHEIRLNQLLD